MLLCSFSLKVSVLHKLTIPSRFYQAVALRHCAAKQGADTSPAVHFEIA